jgi:molybdate transport system substrate-binding protein
MRRFASLALAGVLTAALAIPASGIAATRKPVPRKATTALTKYSGPSATVFAAASLTEVFSVMAPQMKYSFAGSDQLAFQIRQGAPADVFASANVRYPDELYKAGLVTKPSLFTYNNVVVITPKSNPAGITSVQDVAKPGVKVVVADASVPVGSYARTMFRNLGIFNQALANVVSNESDVKAVVAKVALGEADAGVVYQTDVAPVKNKVNVIPVPDSAQPVAAYEIAVVGNTESASAASKFVTFVLSKNGQAWLRRFGFIPASAT